MADSARLRQLQEFLVALERLAREIRLRERLEHREVLLLDAGDERVLSASDVGIGRALLRPRKSRLRERGTRKLPRQSQIIKGGNGRDRLRKALRQKRL